MKRIRSHEKIGRNDPCWCGSGKKYKKCHLHREHEEPIQHWQINKEFKRVLEQRQCLAPSVWRQNCSSQISRAHTVPRSGSLERIARDGHVYSLVVSIQEQPNPRDVIKPRLMGINKASTFTGFCSEHDRSIFAPVENIPFTGTAEQCFLLCYRALAREIFTKQAMALQLEFYRSMDRGMSVDHQSLVQGCAAAMETGYSTVTTDVQAWKHIYDDILVTRRYHRARGYIIELSQVPPIMCSGAFYPEQDFQGNEMQDLLDLNRLPHLITVTSFHAGHRGAVVLSWVDEADSVCVSFVESLHRIGDDMVTDALMRLLFTHFENIHMQPQWWEALSTGHQESLMERHYVSVHPLPRAAGFLADDGLRFDPWPVVERRCLGFEL
jgi:hypothetical protein